MKMTTKQLVGITGTMITSQSEGATETKMPANQSVNARKMNQSEDATEMKMISNEPVIT